jgi:ADP-ribose pyrophosphatase YjhB (NUDIX family)
MLHERQAEYGEQIVATLSRQLTEEFGWTKAALTQMMQFAEQFRDPKIVATLSATIELEPRGRTATVERFAPAGLLR